MSMKIKVYTDDVLESLGLVKENLVENRAAEVGNIFTLGTRYTKAHNLTYKNDEGSEIEPIMGCYGIGPGRLMGTVVEVLSDSKGIIWPESIAPFKVHMVLLGNEENTKAEAEKLYGELNEKNIEVLFDDREDLTAGEKFADADLIGIPYRVVVSKRSLSEGGYEIKKRTLEVGKIVNKEQMLSELKNV